MRMLEGNVERSFERNNVWFNASLINVYFISREGSEQTSFSHLNIPPPISVDLVLKYYVSIVLYSNNSSNFCFS